jgi:hypothetical protein
VLGAGILWRYHKGKVASLKDLLEVERAQTEIAALNARRHALRAQGEAKVREIVEIDARIAERERTIVAFHEEVDNMDDAEVAAAFDRLGY